MNTDALPARRRTRVSLRLLLPLLLVAVAVLLLVLFWATFRVVYKAYYIPAESMMDTLQIGDHVLVNRQSYRNNAPERGDILVFEATPEMTGGKEGIDFIKRIVALPGETVKVTPPRLTVGGVEVDPTAETDDLHDYLRLRLGLKDSDAVKINPDGIQVNGRDKIAATEVARRLGHAGAKVTLQPGQVWVNGKPLGEPYIREDPDYEYPPPDAAYPDRLDKDQYFLLGDNRNHSADSHVWGPVARSRFIGKVAYLVGPDGRSRPIR
jgi:signal peptidase I